ncbi:hypothetical protein T265_06668 [Opisthorchis viverrini]|uniref:Uncharacterized protein n=1 Tax=Opisthorchis viverrini TaxID=6198 RepID=A0A074ZFB0_OPIVI|nr:hypothetical protein T265_06668 [Opisthorchis viverrini]KER25971.1 hypothetical protein T265_06668 [Opisthorchis viverrini]
MDTDRKCKASEENGMRQEQQDLLAHVNLSTVAAHYSDIRNHKDANNEPENSSHNELAKLIEGGSTVYTNTEKKQLR